MRNRALPHRSKSGNCNFCFDGQRTRQVRDVNFLDHAGDAELEATCSKAFSSHQCLALALF